MAMKASALKLCSASLLVALSLHCPLAAHADPVQLKSAADGKPAQGAFALPVSNIAGMLLPNGQMTVDRQNVEVGAVPEWLFDRHTVLTGVLVQLDVSGGTAGQGSNLSGLAFFNGGDWLKNLQRSHGRETVETVSGETIQGKIISINRDQLVIDTLPGQSKTIPLTSVANIISPYSFRFSAPASEVKLSPDTGTTICDASAISFSPARSNSGTKLASAYNPPLAGSTSNTQHFKLPKSDLAGTEGGITKKAIAFMVTADIVNTMAPAIALPLTAALGQRRAHNTLNGYTQANRLNDFVLHIPTVTPPTAMF